MVKGGRGKSLFALFLSFLLVFSNFAAVIVSPQSAEASAPVEVVDVDVLIGDDQPVNWSRDIEYYRIDERPTNTEISDFLNNDGHRYFAVRYVGVGNKLYMNLLRFDEGDVNFTISNGRLNFTSNGSVERMNTSGNVSSMSSDSSLRGNGFIVNELHVSSNEAAEFAVETIGDTFVEFAWDNNNAELLRDGSVVVTNGDREDVTVQPNRTYEYVLTYAEGNQSFFLYLDEPVTTKRASLHSGPGSNAQIEPIEVDYRHSSLQTTLDWKTDIGLIDATIPLFEDIAAFLADHADDEGEQNTDIYAVMYESQNETFLNLFSGDIEFRDGDARLYYNVQDESALRLNTAGNRNAIANDGSISAREYRVYEINSSTIDRRRDILLNLDRIGRSEHEMELAWDSDNQFDEYVLSRDDRQVYAATNTAADDYGQISFNDTGLTAGKEYSYVLTGSYRNGDTNALYVSTLHSRTSTSTVAMEADETHEFVLRWLPVREAIGYTIERNGEPIAQITGLTNGGTEEDTVYHDTGLVAGETYVYDVIPIFEINCDALIESFTTRTVTSSSVELVWSPDSRAEQYEIERFRMEDEDDEDGIREGENTIVEEFSFVDEGLRPNTTYKYVITATNPSCENEEKVELEVTTAPEQPTNFRAEDIGAHEFTLKWTEPEGTEEFRLVGLCDGVEIIETLSSTSITIDNLAPGTICDLQLFAIPEGVDPNFVHSDPALLTVTTLDLHEYSERPDQPTNVRLVEETRTTNSLELAWDDQERVHYYEITRKASGDTNERVWTVNDTFAVDEPLDPNTQYEYEVVAVNNVGPSVKETLDHDGVKTLPAQPERFRVTDFTQNRVTLAWEMESGLEYTLIRFNENGDVEVFEDVTSSYRDRDVEPNQFYEYHLIARNNVGESIPTIASVTTKPMTIFWGSNAELEANAVTSETVTLEWEPSLQMTELIDEFSGYVSALSIDQSLVDQVLPLAEQLGFGGMNDYLNHPRIEELLDLVSSIEANEIITMLEQIDEHSETYDLLRMRVNENLVEVEEEVITGLDRPEYLDTNVEPNTSYTYYVIAQTEYGQSSRQKLSVVDIEGEDRIEKDWVRTPPGQPNLQVGEPLLSNFVPLEWNDVAGASEYILKRFTVAEDGTIDEDDEDWERTLSIEYYHDTDVVTGQAYVYEIIAKNDFNDATNQEGDKASLMVMVPTVPLEGPAFFASKILYTKAELLWEEVAGADLYRLQREDEDGTAYVYEGVNNSFLDEDLEPGESYSYTLEVVKDTETIIEEVELDIDAKDFIIANGKSDTSNPIELLNTNVAALQWEEVEGVRYELYRDGEEVTDYWSPKLVYTDFGLNNDGLDSERNYDYTLDVLEGDTVVDSISVTVRTAESDCGSGDLQFFKDVETAAQTDATTLVWACEDTYTLKRRTVGSGLTFDDVDPLFSNSREGLTYEDEQGLIPNTLYAYKLSNSDESIVIEDVLTRPEAPEDFEWQAQTTNAVLLGWDQPNHGNEPYHYVIYRDGVEIANSPVPGHITTVLDEGLEPTTKYEYTIVTRNDARDSEEVHFPVITNTPFDFTDIGHSSTTLEWDTHPEAVKYIVTRSPGDGDDHSVVFEVERDGDNWILDSDSESNTHFEDERITLYDRGLDPLTVYEYSLEMEFETEVGGEVYEGETGATVGVVLTPDMPLFIGQALDTDSIEVQWSPLDRASDYSLLYREQGESDWRDDGISIEEGMTDYVFEDLTPNTNYEFAIVRDEEEEDPIAILQREYDDEDNEVNRPVATLPLPPSDFTIAERTSDEIDFEWVENRDNGDADASYYLFRDDVEVDGLPVDREGDHTETYELTDQNIDPTETAVYTIVTVNASGVSEEVEILVPGAPGNFTTTEVLPRSIALSWDPVGDETFVLERYGEDEERERVWYVEETEFVDTDELLPNGKYDYELSIYDEEADGDKMQWTNIRLEVPLPPETPLDFRAIDTTFTSAVLEWSPVSGDDIEYVLARDGNVVYEGTDVVFADEGLEAEETYTYTLLATNNETNAESDPTDITVTTDISAEPRPDQITISWPKMEGAIAYQLTRNGELIYEGELTSYTDYEVYPEYEYTYEVIPIGLQGEVIDDNTLVIDSETTPFEVWLEARADVAPTKEWTIDFNQSLNSSTVTNENVYVVRADDNEDRDDHDVRLDTSVILNDPDRETITVLPPEGGYEPGDYYLWVTDDVASAGPVPRQLKQAIRLEFTVSPTAEIEDPYYFEFDERVWSTTVQKERVFTINLTEPLASRTDVEDYVYVTIGSNHDSEKLEGVEVVYDGEEEIKVYPPNENYIPGRSYYLWVRDLQNDDGDPVRVIDHETGNLSEAVRMRFDIGELDIIVNSEYRSDLRPSSDRYLINKDEQWEIIFKPVNGTVTEELLEQLETTVQHYVTVTNGAETVDMRFLPPAISDDDKVSIIFEPRLGEYEAGEEYRLHIADRIYSDYYSLHEDMSIDFTTPVNIIIDPEVDKSDPITVWPQNQPEDPTSIFRDFTIEFEREVALSYERYIYIEDEQGNRVEVTLGKNDHGHITVTAPEDGYQFDSTYYLIIEEELEFEPGFTLDQNYKLQFNTEAEVVTSIQGDGTITILDEEVATAQYVARNQFRNDIDHSDVTWSVNAEGVEVSNDGVVTVEPTASVGAFELHATAGDETVTRTIQLISSTE
ncbi:fibronectin type III domain-containing protein [Desertibacillus haloalkaliphilus]|uniref:fibronectin type III domain-containing protein n=1 Tax=Desertibacillus haloalkaliphilus TaxID=1328930 RepID=UPI001C260C6B|nr:fibronectin type III domain-containing protein [Desertibacillus haloalkaliphilus]MBU8905949.1 fibronectin type III domain-containing protein [Desertibacillus haloalkaliphilus]